MPQYFLNTTTGQPIAAEGRVARFIARRRHMRPISRDEYRTHLHRFYSTPAAPSSTPAPPPASGPATDLRSMTAADIIAGLENGTIDPADASAAETTRPAGPRITVMRAIAATTKGEAS